MSRSIAVLGGGVAGVVAAAELARDGATDVFLFESQPELGGLHRSVDADGLVFDIGAFIFDTSHALFASFPMLREHFPLLEHHSLAITPAGTIDRYPLSPRGFLRDHGPLGLLRAGGGLLAAKLRHRRRDSLPSYLRYYLGEHLYRESGLQSYIYRFFGADESLIDLAFARQRLGSVAEECSLRRNALRLTVEMLGIAGGPLLWSCHVRPPEGFAFVYARIRALLESRGVGISTGTAIRKITRRSDGFVITFDDGERHVDRILSSIPLATLAHTLLLPVAREPEHVTLYSLFFRYRGDPGYHAPLLYNFTHDGLWKRITLFSFYYGTDNGDHYFAVECTGPSGGEDRLEMLAAEFRNHIQGVGLFRGQLIHVGGVVTPNAYPISWSDARADVVRLRRAVSAEGIEVIGRQGRFEHISSHQVAGDSRAAAARVSQQGSADVR